MSKKHHGGPAPVPPGNRPGGNAPDGPSDEGRTGPPEDDGTGFHEQDPQRRLGGFEGAGEHSRVQPSPLNDGGHGGHLGRSKGERPS